MKKVNKLFLILTIVWMIVIFAFSAQPGEKSSGMSGGITRLAINIFFDDFDEYSPVKQIETAETIQYIIRKGAHFTEYAILGFLSVMTVFTHIYSDDSRRNIWRKVVLKGLIIGQVFSSLYAISDELHQKFVPDRMPAAGDVLIDSAGAFAGIILAGIMFYICKISKEKE